MKKPLIKNLSLKQIKKGTGGGVGGRTRECYGTLPSRRKKTMYQFAYLCFSKAPHQRHSDTIPFSTIHDKTVAPETRIK